MRLDGQVALVTGASGTLGVHFAQLLARAGAAVAVTARRIDRLAALAEAIEADGGRACAVALDVTDTHSIEAALATVTDALGSVDILINNSGIAVTKPALDLDEAAWDRVIDTNLKGAWLTAQAVARAMVERGRGGSIVNIASILGLGVSAQVPAYCASKAGMIQLTKALALEWARHGIRVNALAPGYIESDLNRDFFASPAGQAIIKRVPQRRLGQPADLDGPLLLLASAASRFMTGTVLVVDGGHSVGAL